MPRISEWMREELTRNLSGDKNSFERNKGDRIYEMKGDG